MTATVNPDVNKLRADELWVLVPLVTKQVVSAGEAIYIRTAGYGAVKDGLRYRRLLVGTLMTGTILRVQKGPVAEGDRALVRPLGRIQVGLSMTTKEG
jgi:hypothetical protein